MHNRQSTLAVDTTKESFGAIINALWEAGVFVRVDGSGGSITVQCETDDQLRKANEIVSADGEAEPIADDQDDNGESSPPPTV